MSNKTDKRDVTTIKISKTLWGTLTHKKASKGLSFDEYITYLLNKQESAKVQLVLDLRKFFYEHPEILKPVYRSDDGFVNAILKHISLWEDGITETEQNFKLKIIEK